MTKYGKMVLLVFFLCGTVLLSAQDSYDRNKIKTLKIAFITERLALSSSEAEIFWPMYNAYEEEMEALRSTQHKEVFDEIDKGGTLSEGRANTLVKRYLEIEEKEEELEKEFYTKLTKSLSARKTILLFGAEHDFRKQLIKQMRNRNKVN